ncbi:Transcription factor [Exophiala dermatitidis]|nr:Transcription factor [Exophiala dermatitidis]KAJ4535599.1 Transcription factor [Exophiala dermatitidis]
MSKEDATESGPSSRESSEGSEARQSSARRPSSGKKSNKKSFNHKDAENKRRTAIRQRFTELSHMVPGAEGQERSEQVMLSKTTEFLRAMLLEQRRLIEVADSQGIQVDPGWRLRDDDLGGPGWKAKNMEQYESSKQKKGTGTAQAGNNGDEND